MSISAGRRSQIPRYGTLCFIADSLQVRRLLFCCGDLESLNLSGCYNLSNLTIALQRQGSVPCKLKSLSLGFLSSLTDSCTHTLRQIGSSLHVLDVSGSGLTDDGIQQVPYHTWYSISPDKSVGSTRNPAAAAIVIIPMLANDERLGPKPCKHVSIHRAHCTIRWVNDI